MVVKKFRWTVLAVVPLTVAVSLAGCAYVGGGSSDGAMTPAAAPEADAADDAAAAPAN